jgi:hypothetical protein
MMERRDKVLYHQIHPLKLATDFGTAIVAAVLLWRHHLLAAALVGLVPSVVVSALLIRFAPLEWLKESAFGRYVAQYMTRSMEAVRFGGVAIFWAGAWLHRPLAAAGGFLLILAVWSRGLLRPRGGLRG